MNLTKLTDEILLSTTQNLARTERELTIRVLHHLREIERRLLFAKLGFASLFEYCVRELKYSEGAAQRRISSMRLLKTLPELEEKIEKGTLSLSTLSQAQVFFRQEKVETTKAKKDLLLTLENKSFREVERELVNKASVPEKLAKEKIRPVSATHTELKILIEESVLKEIEELKNLLARSIPNASIKDIITYSLAHTLKSVRPKAPTETRSNVLKSLPPAPAVKRAPASHSTRYIATEVRRKVWQRDSAQCTYTHNGRRCSSKHGLEFDHIHPHALGGTNTVENLRLRCPAHNKLAAIETYGHEKMAQFVPRLR